MLGEYLSILFGQLPLPKHLPKLWRYVLTWRSRQVFGTDIGKEFRIIYNVNIPPQGTVFAKPAPKVPRDNYRWTKDLTSVNSCATTRAIGYLVYSFGGMASRPPIVSSDVDADDRMDISFISIGGVTNLKTCDILRDASNYFLDFRGGSIVDRSSQLPIVEASARVRYGLIIKINPQSNPDRTWICCAGFEEWGTSGGAWFLATKWKSIRKWAKGKPFAIITGTEYGSDESTKLVYRFLTPGDVADAAKRFAATVTTTTQVSSKTTSTSMTSTAPADEIQ